MTLPSGAWAMNANGVQSVFRVLQVGAGGAVQAALGDNPIVGVWDETSRILNFTPLDQSQPIPDVPQPLHFRGHLFSTPADPEPGQDVVWTLAGYFQVTDIGRLSGIGNARRSTFGWFAQITETF